ncbi:hypothetical protein FRC15_008454, partial [Serendipita sp. 397]
LAPQASSRRGARMSSSVKTSKFRSFVQSVKDFDIAKLFSPAPAPQIPRTVYVNRPLPDSYYVHRRGGQRKVHKDHRYSSNQVVTSKYTILTFLPRNLLEQFRRIANM